jgi:hypothetical protein
VNAARTIAVAKKNSYDPIWQTTKSALIISKYLLKNPVLFQEPGRHIHLMYLALKEMYWNNAVLYSIYPENEGQACTKTSLLYNKLDMIVRGATCIP